MRWSDNFRTCVCGHTKSMHERRADVLACAAPECPCGPGCIHTGFVCDDGTVLEDEQFPMHVVARESM